MKLRLKDLIFSSCQREKVTLRVGKSSKWAFPEIVRYPPVEDIGYPGGSQKIGYPGGLGISRKDIQGV